MENSKDSLECSNKVLTVTSESGMDELSKLVLAVYWNQTLMAN